MLFIVVEHLISLQLSSWTLMSQVQKYVLLFTDHFTRTPYWRPSLCLYTWPSTCWSSFLGGGSNDWRGSCIGFVLVNHGVEVGSPDMSILGHDWRVCPDWKSYTFPLWHPPSFVSWHRMFSPPLYPSVFSVYQTGVQRVPPLFSSCTTVSESCVTKSIQLGHWSSPN